MFIELTLAHNALAIMVNVTLIETFSAMPDNCTIIIFGAEENHFITVKESYKEIKDRINAQLSRNSA